jgi:hypothetical protein
MLNEGIISRDTTVLVKTHMIRTLHELGPTTPEAWERATFRAITGHDPDEVDWSVEDNQAGYYSWIRSFDQLINELIEDGFVCQETVGHDRFQLSPVDTDRAIDWARFVYSPQGQ